jgi:hypothetical protein
MTSPINLTNESQIAQGGSPDPLDYRRARPIGTLFLDGRALSNADPTTVLIPIAGALLVRLRGKIDTTEAVPPNPLGVLSFSYRRSPPNHATVYSTGLSLPHVSVNVVKATEFLIDIAPGGEPYLAVTFTPAVGVDAGKVISPTFFDIMQQ